MENILERVIRDLIREGYLSRARALLSLFRNEYPYLELELEAASGNWKAVMQIYESLSEERKKEYQTLYKTAKDRFKGDYAEDVIDALQETERNNFEGSIATLEAVSKAYPELVEIVALKLDVARRKKDRERVRIFEEALRKLDPSHPVLAKREKSAQTSLINLVVLVAVLASVALSLVGLLKPAFDEKRFAELKNEFATVNTKVDNLDQKMISLSVELNNVKAQLAGLTNLKKDLEELGNTVARSSKETQEFVYNQSQELVNLLRSFATTSAPATTALAVGDVSVETLRSLWLTGYRLYREGKYSDAFSLLSAVSKALNGKDAYFKDDVSYYMMSHITWR